MGRVARQVAIALGSNLGDRQAHLAYAVGRLRQHLDQVVASSVVETAPVQCPDPQQPYLNAAVVGRSALPARELLDLLLRIESERGRQRPYPNAPRTLDLDLVLLGAEIIVEPGLHVPHPRFRERAFVLDPLAEIAPELVDPVTGLTVAGLRARLART